MASRVVARHGLILGGLVLFAAGVFGNALFVHPLDPDNLVAMSVGPLHHNPWDYFSGASHSFYRPSYRPVAELSLWIQYRIFGLDPHTYFGANIALLAICAMLLYGLVVLATGSRSFAVAAALAAFLDVRSVLAPLWILERQTTIALATGLTAMLLLFLPTRRQRLVWVGIFVLLLVSAQAKEYGLAFIFAVPLLAYLQELRWRPVALASLAAAGAYAVLRLGVAGGASGRFCDQMGYFHSTNTVCYSQYLGFHDVKQKLYNAVASFVGTFLPSLFDGDGRLIGFSLKEFVVPAIVTAAAIVAFVKRPRWALPLLVLVVVNALLNFVLYRGRNQVIGLSAVYASSAIGLQWLYLRLRPGRWATAAVAVTGILVLVWLAQQTVLRPRTVISFQEVAVATNSCAYLKRFSHVIDPDVVASLKRRYHLPNPDCRGYR